MTINEQLARARSVVANLPPLAPRPQVGDDDLMAVLQEPSALFGEPGGASVSSREAARTVEWDLLPQVLQDVDAQYNLSCSELMEGLQVAADLLRRNGLRLARGNPAAMHVFVPEMEEVGFRYVLRIDAPQEVADTLNDAVRSRWIDLDLCRDGFLFAFIGQEDEGALAESPEVAGDGVHEGAIHGHHHV